MTACARIEVGIDVGGHRHRVALAVPASPVIEEFSVRGQCHIVSRCKQCDTDPVDSRVSHALSRRAVPLNHEQEHGRSLE